MRSRASQSMPPHLYIILFFFSDSRTPHVIPILLHVLTCSCTRRTPPVPNQIPRKSRRFRLQFVPPAARKVLHIYPRTRPFHFSQKSRTLDRPSTIFRSRRSSAITELREKVPSRCFLLFFLSLIGSPPSHLPDPVSPRADYPRRCM